MKNLFTLAILLLISFQINATHNRSGEIIVKQTEALTVEASIITYTKASSLAADRDTLIIRWGDGTSSIVARSNGANNDGEYLEFDTKLNIYTTAFTANHTYQSAGTYVVHMIDPNRNAGILNVNPPNSDNVPFYVETVFTVTDNNSESHSPILLQPAVDIAFVGEPFIHVPNAYDIDGDSLTYEFQIPMSDIGETVSNFIFPNQIQSGPDNNFSINPSTGEIVWDAPQQEGEYNIAIRVRSFRNGVEIESVVRDMQIMVFPDEELMPDIVQLNGPPNNNLIAVAVGDTISIDFEISEPDMDQQELWVSSTCGLYDYFNSPATFTTSINGLNATAHFEWIVKNEHARQQPYQLAIRAKGVNDEFGLANYLVFQFSTDLTTSIGPDPSLTTIEFQLSPNPVTNDFIQLSLNSDDLKDLQYTVSNGLGISFLSGRIQNKTTNINTKTLASGWYSLTLKGNNAFGSQIFFVQ